MPKTPFIISCGAVVLAIGCAGKTAGGSGPGPDGEQDGQAAENNGTDGGTSRDGPSRDGIAPSSGDAGAGGVVPGPGGILSVRILDPAGNPTAARVNVVGPDNAYYEPDAANNVLYDFSIKRRGFRLDTLPARYYGSFFYSEGAFEVRLPPGMARIEVRKGYSHYLAVAEAEVVAERRTTLDITVRPMVDMSVERWFASDTHLHFERPDVKDLTLVKLLAAENIQFGTSLSYNDYRAAYRLMAAQGAYGEASIQAWQGSQLASGNEHISNALGHVTQMLMTGLPAVSKSDMIHKGPALATVYDETLKLSGAMGFNHGGGGEVFVDVVLRKSDYLELLQFASWRNVGLGGYYDMLNSGFRYPLAGASDFPFCRTLADSISYVMDGPQPTFDSMTGGLIRGESFATSGPLLFLTVDGKGPGSEIEYPGAGSHTLAIKVKAYSSYLPFDHLEIVVNGAVAANFNVTTPVLSMEKETTVTVNGSSWIAARCQGAQQTNAHTNPVWVYMNAEAPFDARSASRLKGKVDEDVSVYPVTQDVTDAVARARAEIQRIVNAGSNTKPAVPNFPRNAGIASGTRGSTLLPAMLPRPAPAVRVKVDGTVVDETGAPVADATVSARGASPSAKTDAAGPFSLASVPVDEALYLRVSKTGHATTNTSYLNPRCSGDCLKIISLTSARADALMAAREPKTALAELQKRPWVTINVVDDQGKLKAGVGGKIFPDGYGWVAVYGTEPLAGQLGFMAQDGKFGGAASVASPPGGIQAAGFIPVEFNYAEPDVPDNSKEPNLLVSFPTLKKDLVFPVFAGQVSYGVVVDGLAGSKK